MCLKLKNCQILKLLTPSTFKFYKPKHLIIPRSRQIQHQSKVITFPQLPRNTQQKRHTKTHFYHLRSVQKLCYLSLYRLVHRAPKTMGLETNYIITWIGFHPLYPIPYINSIARVSNKSLIHPVGRPVISRWTVLGWWPFWAPVIIPNPQWLKLPPVVPQ